MIDACRQMIENAVGPLRARCRGIVRRAVLRTLSNGTKMATGTFAITDDDVDVADGVEVLNPIGVSIRPGAGVEAVLLAVGGNPAVRVALPFARGQRLTGDALAEGEVALHIGVAGQVVHLKLDGSVEVRASTGAGGSIVLKANGDVVLTPSATGRVYLGQDGAAKKLALADDVDAAFADIRLAFNVHTHPTAPPGIVSTPTVVPTVIPIPPIPPTGSTNVYGKG